MHGQWQVDGIQVLPYGTLKTMNWKPHSLQSGATMLKINVDWIVGTVNT